MITIPHTNGIISEENQHLIPETFVAKASKDGLWYFFETNEEYSQFQTDNGWNYEPTENSIEWWDKYGMTLENDYLCVRKKINDVFTQPEKGWSNCSDAEKSIIIKHFLYHGGTSDSDKVTFLISSGKCADVDAASLFLINSWNRFNEINRRVLNERWVYVKPVVLKYLSMNDAENLFETVKILVNDMLLIGRLGIGYGLGNDTKNGILNYVMSDNQFDGTGMEFDGYTLKTGDWNTFKSDIRDVLEYGIYNKESV